MPGSRRPRCKKVRSVTNWSPKEELVKVFVRLSAVVALIAALAVAAIGAASSSAKTASKASSSFKLGVVTDIGGLNDHGFNHLAYEGLLEAKSQLHIGGEVIPTSSASDY